MVYADFNKIDLNLDKLPYSTTLDESLYLMEIGVSTTYHDMHYSLYAKQLDGSYKPCTFLDYIQAPTEYRKAILKSDHADIRYDNQIPAWSQTSLIKQLTKEYTDSTNTKYTFKLTYSNMFNRFCVGYYTDNGIATVEMSGSDIIFLLIQLYKFKIENKWPL